MNSKKINIYFDTKYLSDPKKCELMLYPFVAGALAVFDDPDRNRFDEYISLGKDYFNLSSDLASCDLAIWPESWNSQSEQTKEFLARVEAAGKPAVFFFNNDSSEKVDVGHNFVFRTSFYHSSKGQNEFAVPGFSEDFVKNYFAGDLPLRTKGPKPVVGYCGYAGKSIWLISLKKMLTGPDGWIIRSKAIKRFLGNKGIVTNFIIRNGFWGGIYKNGRNIDYQKIKDVRREFVDNIVNSDYVLCARGRGNFSYRLYEILSSGRIPVFINTDCVLPYENYIPWKELCVWVEARDVKNISQKIIAFHNSLSPEDFINLQKRCRSTWEEWLSPQGFFRNFYKHFDFWR